jgi:hypothetical protein
MTMAHHSKRTLLMGLFHLICLSVYMIPILHHTFTKQQEHKHEINRVAVLDESHIMSESNQDINGDNVSLETIFTNDYWGRPMNSPSSHKSWRPLTVLSFRWLTSKGNPPAIQLLIHRLFNIITHAAVAELVGALAVQLVQGFLPLGRGATEYLQVLHLITKALFIVHPTHVEVTANAANRPHLLAALCAALLSHPDLPWGLFLLLLVSGYLCCETFLFTLPPILVTMTLIVLSHKLMARRQSELEEAEEKASKKADEIGKAKKNDDVTDDKGDNENENDDEEDEESEGDEEDEYFGKAIQLFGNVLIAVLPRAFILVLSAFAYFGGRLMMDSLSIPEGLIRPAENPFYRLQGWTRFRSYLYVLGIHIAKSWSLDFIGFSHEYGHACILPVTEWDDIRFTGTLLGYALIAVSTILLVLLTFESKPLVTVLVILQLGWMITLFPISGIVKVGTFIADRIVVANTISTCIVLGTVFTSLIVRIQKEDEPPSSKHEKSETPRKAVKSPSYSIISAMVVLLVLGYQWRVVHYRTLEWMGWIPLLNSALKTCPRFAKAHLELSKISNGLYPEEFNLTKSRWHVEQAERFDPNFCDVNQQYAQISIQENKYLEFEERLSKAVTCTFTTGGSAELWQRYWKMTLDPQQNTNQAVLQAAQQRYNNYMAEIQKVIDRETKREEEEQRLAKSQKKKSPFFWDHLKS